jgi:hypothetical protein
MGLHPPSSPPSSPDAKSVNPPLHPPFIPLAMYPPHTPLGHMKGAPTPDGGARCRKNHAPKISKKDSRMTRYAITLAVPKIGPVKHIVKAESIGDAQARAMAAHPGSVIVKAEKAWGEE